MKDTDDEEGKPEKRKRRRVFDLNEHDSSEADVRRMNRKRKLSPDGGKVRAKKRRVVEKKTPDTSGDNGESFEEVGRVRGRKWKNRDDEEGKPEKRKRRRVFDLNEHDSAETDGRRISRKTKLSPDGRKVRAKKRRVVEKKTLDTSRDNCESFEEVGRVRGMKWKDRDDEEANPEKRKRRRVFDLNEHDPAETDGRRISRKTKLSPDGGKVRAKKRRVVEKKTQDTSGDNQRGESFEEVGRVRGRKWKNRDDEEGKPEKRKRRRVFDLNEHDSAETDGRRISRKTKLSPDGRKVRAKKRRVVEKKTLDTSRDNCESFEEVGRVRGRKWKDRDDEEANPEKRKRRRVFDLNEHDPAETDGRRISRKTKLSPDGGKVRAKKRRVVELKTQDTSGDNPRGESFEEVGRVRGRKWKDRDDEEANPEKRKRRRVFDLNEHDPAETDGRRISRKTKLSPDGGKVRAKKRRVVELKTQDTSGDNPRGESFEEVGRVRGRKWKDRDDEEGKPEKRKRRRVFDLNEHDPAETDGRRISRKRKLSPDGGKVRAKKRSVLELKTQDTSGDNGESFEEVGRVRGRKWKNRDDEEAKPEKRKRRRVFDLNEHDPAETDGRRIIRKTKLSPDGGKVRAKKRRVVEKKTQDTSGDNPRVNLEDKYLEMGQLGEGGCGTVFAGFRKADMFPVAIKHIPLENQISEPVRLKGKMLPTEVAIMLKLTAEKNDSVGKSAPVSLLDWYDLGFELIVVMERPVPAIDLSTYIEHKGGTLRESKAKTIMKQLVDAAIGLEQSRVFHRDIKPPNILIETGQSVPRVRLIDFGLSCLVKIGSFYTVFYGTDRYAPPEYRRYSVYRAGPTTVWQLGTVLYEMLHNQKFITKRFLRKELKICGRLCKNLKDFLQLCLKQDPKLRPTLTELQLHPWLK